jgi:CYTH domain-containing protein
MSLQELVEKGYVQSIQTESTCLGDGYTIKVQLRHYSIRHVTIDVTVDETLTDAIGLINAMIEFDNSLPQTQWPDSSTE